MNFRIAELTLAFRSAVQVLEMQRTRREEDITFRIVLGVEFPITKKVERVERLLYIHVRLELSPHTARGLPRRAGPKRMRPVENKHVGHPAFRKMIRNRSPRDPAADDHD